ncbi:MAG TPA: PspC domain-containing protein [Acidimicrobiia bacterium]|nr:PspC domain-containing protein [Acidimicrobiia bacterium]
MAARSTLSRADLLRPTDGRFVAGVAVGLADAFGLDPMVVRCGFVVLAVASGLGFVLYGVAWALMPVGGERVVRRDEADVVAVVGFAVVVLGLLLAVRAFGLWPGDVIVWPLAFAMLGLALLAMRADAPGAGADLPDWSLLGRLSPHARDAVAVLIGTKRGALARMIAGLLCVAAGVAAMVVTADSWSALSGAVIAAVAMLIGIVLVIGPGLSRAVTALISERRERIRANERAEMAAHLHDSVLQTLAMVQRRADDPREVVRLARLQERELRDWLLRGEAPAADGSLGAAVEALATAAETEHGVPVEVVRVRDCPGEGMEPLLPATREAIVNAARHSGATSVSVYLEVEPNAATVFVRDRGHGFDLATVPDDRGGIANSIVGRMERAGGRAKVRSSSDGTEVELTLPRSAS